MIIKNAEETTLWEIVDKSILRIPAYQRFYEWDEEMWAQLWEDISLCIDSKKSLVFGIIFLEGKANSRTLNVIDGQQRIVTLLILLRAIIASKKLGSQETRRLREWLEKACVLAEKTANKIELNSDHLNRYFQATIIKGQPEKVLDIDERWRHVRNIKQSLIYFTEKLCATNGNRVRAIRNFVQNAIEVVAVQIEDEFEAFEIFESINSKKTDLSIADLTKNLVLRKSRKQRHIYEQVVMYWDRLSDRDVFRTSTTEFSRFLRIWWASCEKIVRGKGFFKQFRKSEFLEKNSPLHAVKELVLAAENYEKLVSPEESHWRRSRDEKEIYLALKRMHRLGLKTVHPLLLAAMHSPSIKNMALLRQIVLVAEANSFIRVVLKKERPGPLEIDYSALAVKISKKKTTGKKALAELRASLLESLQDLEHHIETMSFERNNLTAAYILSRILKDKQRVTVLTDALDPINVTLEHILPENSYASRDAMWADIQGDSSLKDELAKNAGTSSRVALLSEYHSQYCYCIGNLALLTPDTNSSVSDSAFALKLKAYKRYEGNNWLFSHNQCVLGKSQWGAREIKARADLLARTFEEVVRKLC